MQTGERGLEITRLVEGAMAELHGLAVGDVLVAVEGEPVEGPRALVRALSGGASYRVDYLRRGRRRRARVERLPYPAERVRGARVRYGDVDVGGHRVRTILASQDESAPIVMFLPGIRPESVDWALAEHLPVARFAHGLAEAGFSLLRVDRFGLGDSEGPPCATIDFETERAIYEAALDALPTGAELFLFGHSVGGMLAPLLARRRDLRGVIAYGTSPRRWGACLRDGIDRQLRLRGVDEAEIDAQLERFDADPFEDGRYGRSRAFHTQLDRARLDDAWRALDAPALFLVGECDWVVDEAEQVEAAVLARGEIARFDGLDHAFTRHGSIAESLERYGQGAFDRRMLETCVDWLIARS
ncbi:MAG: alpha/beta hydrolase [Sandaracinaceae bacterium]